MELLYDRRTGWLGLQRICARTRSFEELSAIIERQPTAKSPSATVAAGPGENFERIAAMAKSIGAGLVSAGFALRPADQVMERDSLTRWKFLDTIDRDPSMVVFVGHGGNDDNGPFLQISNEDRLRPRDLAQLRFDSGPIAHLECCVAGHAVYFGGGYWNSYAVSFLANGASCCLVSNRIVFGEPSEFFCRELYGAVDRSRIAANRGGIVGSAQENRRCLSEPAVLGDTGAVRQPAGTTSVNNREP